MMKRMWLLVGCVCLAGCDEKKDEAAQKAEAAAAAPAPTVDAAAEAQKAEAAAEAKAAEAKKKEEAVKQAAVDANPITECCRALGQRGFMQHSPEYMGASEVCGKAMEAKKDLSSVMAEIKKSIKANPLPAECEK